MKFHFTHSHAPRPVGLLHAVAMAFAISLGSLHAQDNGDLGNSVPDNIATTKKGAFVTYSSSLSQGLAGNTLIDNKHETQHIYKLSFVKPVGPQFVVVDLGNDYKMDTIKLKFEGSIQVKVYALDVKPTGNATWVSLIQGKNPILVLTKSNVPGLLNGTEGEFLLLVFDPSPGQFWDLVVTGFPTHRRPLWTEDRDHNPLNETPIPRRDFPHVPSSSP